ncbi:MAG: hypothetical protein GF344_15920 [Chitinivibrionales bacterium]|nr:hypothetical protein [Chitinivibrionales bacterium]MBD3358185.1 hypothetical protein [Chitinivibrionales bacterium]
MLFGRAYNAFADEANMGIPAKLASRGKLIIPWDMLPFEQEPCDPYMCWAHGQNLLRAAHFAARHPGLFGIYITNFSCGPDSFLLGYFRDIMGTKPSLTLELDSHTADAGVNTRIDAFCDLVNKYLRVKREIKIHETFRPATIETEGNRKVFVSSDGTSHSFFDPRVHVVLPSMGRLSSESLAAVLEGSGIRTSAVPVYDTETLKIGRANSSCKECLPLQLVTGALLRHLEERKDDNELCAYFMPTCGGNCRFTQYSVFLRGLVEKKQLRNVALLSLTNEDGYAGMPVSAALGALKAFMIADVMTDIRNALIVLAKDRKHAESVFEKGWEEIMSCFRQRAGRGIYGVLKKVAANLASVPRRMELDQAKVVALLGEIFVRRDNFSSGELVERLARHDIIVRQAHVFEWLNYCDYNVKTGVYEPLFTFRGRAEFAIRRHLQRYYERRIKGILAQSGLFRFEPISIEEIMEYGLHFFHPRFTGEAVLAAGGFFKEIMHTIHGAVSIGPFGCMPTRVTEAVMSVESTLSTKEKLDKSKNGYHKQCQGITALPFLTIEQDGNRWPRLVEAKLEAFALQVERLHDRLQGGDNNERQNAVVYQTVRRDQTMERK